MNDPRRGLPSASQMNRLAQCPGSLELINLLREHGKLFEFPTAAANTGVRIHLWLAIKARGKNPPPLGNEELYLAQHCDELRESLVSDFSEGQPVQHVIEERFWYRNAFWVLFSGQPDYVALDLANRRALILDYKTGRVEADEAADNLQLRTEVVLLKQAYPELTKIRAAIIEPFVTWDSVSVEYVGDALAQAEAQILEIVSLAKWESDKRVPGPWCRYCPARTHCREAIHYVETLSNITVLPMELPRGDHGVTFWERIKVAKTLIEAWESAYKAILEEEPNALPGYVLPERGRERRYVAFPAKLKSALAEYLSAEEIDGCATYHLSKIEELLGLKMKLAGKELSQLFANLTKHVVGISHDVPFIRAMTKRERETKAVLPK